MCVYSSGILEFVQDDVFFAGFLEPFFQARMGLNGLKTDRSENSEHPIASKRAQHFNPVPTHPDLKRE